MKLAFNIYMTCLEEGVCRVVAASSNHAADFYEPLILDKKMDLVTPDVRALSDDYYGWAKEAYEHLGFVFAVGKDNGRPLENMQVRIGAPRCPAIHALARRYARPQLRKSHSPPLLVPVHVPGPEIDPVGLLRIRVEIGVQHIHQTIQVSGARKLGGL